MHTDRNERDGKRKMHRSSPHHQGLFVTISLLLCIVLFLSAVSEAIKVEVGPSQDTINQVLGATEQGADVFNRAINVLSATTDTHYVIDSIHDDVAATLEAARMMARPVFEATSDLTATFSRVADALDAAEPRFMRDIDVVRAKAVTDVKQAVIEIERQFLVDLRDFAQNLSVAVDRKTANLTEPAVHAYNEVRSGIRVLAENINYLKSLVSSDDFADRLMTAGTSFVDRTLNTLERSSQLHDFKDVVRQSIYDAIISSLIALGTFKLLVLLTKYVYATVAPSSPSSKYLLVLVLVCLSSMIMVSLLLVPTAPPRTKHVCPMRYDVIRPVNRAIDGSKLVFDQHAASGLTQYMGPLFIYSESGPFAVGKSTIQIILQAMMLPPDLLDTCPASSFLTARNKTNSKVDFGDTRGMSVIAIPRHMIDPMKLPLDLRLKWFSAFTSSTEGTILLIDVEGTQDITSDRRGSSELLELLAVMSSTYHSFVVFNRVNDAQGLANLARIGLMLKIVDVLSSPRAGCAGWNDVRVSSVSPARLVVRIRNGISSRAIEHIKCVVLSDDRQSVIDVPDNCSLHVPLLTDDMMTKLSISDAELIRSYFKDALEFVQPTLLEGEQQIIWDLQEIDGRHDAVKRLWRMSERPGVIYSIRHHHRPSMLRSGPKMIDGKVVDGAAFVSFLKGSYEALSQLYDNNVDIFASMSAPDTQQAISDIMIKTVQTFINGTSDNIETINDVMARLPIESLPCTPGWDLCPLSLATDMFRSVSESLLSRLCVLEAMLDEQTLLHTRSLMHGLLNKTMEEVINRQFMSCMYNWTVGPWSKCVGDCNGTQSRTVGCVSGKGQARDNQCCLMHNKVEPPSIKTCDVPIYTYNWTTTEWPRAPLCEAPTPCVPGRNPSSDLKPATLYSGFNERSYLCERCNADIVPDSECIDALGPKSKPARERDKCFKNQLFYTATQWSPAVCTCGSDQTRVLACDTCYADDAPLALSDCDGRSISSIPPSRRKCVGYEWYVSHISQCSGTCGTQHNVYACRTCTGQHQPDSACSSLPRPPAPDISCQPDYYWKYDVWPTFCNCDKELTRTAECWNRCTNSKVEQQLCAAFNLPSLTCQCGACPLSRCRCVSCCGAICWPFCSKETHCDKDESLDHRAYCAN